ncbi:hypothetical protein GUITHDRAFT_109310 [Guillardia theta CCMP2712]|uniref:Uncharacterized protein n=1 Tax=Guillardia theta (strain CCMP2712) TaxID=905079 RepID=L1J9X5_GUITC|nr:hypothetical protein GUITHDRAFT_109310 [Guillardia theta CCMP2712]EKX44890.1 hypothetical protein GUITHDRAFT_109310 [Guillardia theta CCMP2712]|eukprot:XP_005831870.1 hypothetical protein GUITHDRAFT_109310 [Guillardia theta CCMP2712]
MRGVAMVSIGMLIAIEVGGFMALAAATASHASPLFLAPPSSPPFKAHNGFNFRERMLKHPLYSACKTEGGEDSSKRFLGSRRLALIRNGFRKGTMPLDPQVRFLGSRRLAFIIRNLLKPQYIDAVRENQTGRIALASKEFEVQMVELKKDTEIEDQTSVQILEAPPDIVRSFSLGGEHKFQQAREEIYSLAIPVFLEQISKLEEVSSCDEVKGPLDNTTSEVYLAWRWGSKDVSTKIVISHDFPSGFRVSTSDHKLLAVSGSFVFSQQQHGSCALRYNLDVEHEVTLPLNESAVAAALKRSCTEIAQRRTKTQQPDAELQVQPSVEGSRSPSKPSPPKSTKHGAHHDSEAMSVSRSMTVHAPSTICFQIASDVHSYPEWVPAVKNVKVLSTLDEGKASQAELTFSALGYSLSYMVDYDLGVCSNSPHAFSWDSFGNGPGSIEGSYGFESLGENTTKIHYKLTIDPGMKVPHFIKSTLMNTIAHSALQVDI